ncbi:hypothetical protein [Planococcus sp. CAU13]|uniref:hypothetical protein n=1 Tax=Planococcus sp. CAU13 TaxID=1541197 RepID=UPI00052FEDCC|nr:hypothetical protein [Planococcus sp. CAU13]
MNGKIFCFSMLLLFVLMGCSLEKEVDKSENTSSDAADNMQSTSQKPPNLKISVNGKNFFAAMNGFNWSYFDEEENMMAGIEAETVGAEALLENWKAEAVDADSTIELIFGEEPLTYQVHALGSFYNREREQKEVILDGQSGKTGYEVKATWEQGTAYYVFPLDVQPVK